MIEETAATCKIEATAATCMKTSATCMIEETAATCMIEETAATCMIVSTMRLVTIYGLLQPVSVGYHTRESESCLVESYNQWKNLLMLFPYIYQASIILSCRFRVKTTEVRRVHVHSSLLVVTSNQNASNKKTNRLNIYPKPRMSHYIPCLIAE
jgi:hypothetical protein